MYECMYVYIYILHMYLSSAPLLSLTHYMNITNSELRTQKIELVRRLYSNYYRHMKQQRQQIVLVTARSSLLKAVGPSLNHFTADSPAADGCQRTAAGAISCPGVGLVPEFGCKTCHCRGSQKESIQHFVTSISHLMGADKNTHVCYTASL